MDKELTSTSIVTFNDLNVFGIQPLTGEACVFNERVLCDVSLKGKELLKDYFGLLDLELNDPMNSFVGADRSEGSLMLSRAVLADIGLFALMHAGALAVIRHADGTLQGIADSAYLSAYEQAGYPVRRNPLAGINR